MGWECGRLRKPGPLGRGRRRSIPRFAGPPRPASWAALPGVAGNPALLSSGERWAAIIVVRRPIRPRNLLLAVPSPHGSPPRIPSPDRPGVFSGQIVGLAFPLCTQGRFPERSATDSVSTWEGVNRGVAAYVSLDSGHGVSERPPT